MKAREFCNREVVVLEKDASVADAAGLMREHHVGSVVIIDSPEEPRRPVGVLTDRDIVMEFVTQNVSPTDVSVGDAARYKLVTVDQDAGLFEVIELMRSQAVRRIPVVDDRGSLVGLVASDDALELLAEQLSDLVSVVAKQRRRETRDYR